MHSNVYLPDMSEPKTRGSDLLRIGQVADRAKVGTDTLRYYERIGLVEPTTRSTGGYRLYDRTVFDRLAFVKKAQALGLTLEEVGAVLEAALDGSPPCDHVRTMLRARLQEVDDRMADLRALRTTLREALDRSREGAPLDGALCDIIESQELPVHRGTKPRGGDWRSASGTVR